MSSLAQGMGDAFSSVGKTVYNAASGIVNTMDKAVKTVVTAGGAAMVAFGTQAVNAAAEIAAENAQFEASFGDLADEATSAYGKIAKETNILSTRLQTTGTKGFSQLKGAGLSANDALEASARLLNLAADGAAYYDMSLEDTDERLRSFLRGNVEAGDAIGLFTSEMQRNNKAVELYGKKWTELTEAQKQMTMLDIAEGIYKASGAVGQAARESEGWANVTANLAESWRQVLGVVGMPIMDAITPVIQGITSYMVENKDKLGDFAASLGEIITLLTTGHEAEGITAASGMINGFLDTISTQLESEDFWAKGQEIFDALKGGFQSAIDNLAPAVASITQNVSGWIVEYNGTLLEGGLKIIEGIAEGITANKDGLSASIGNLIESVTTWLKSEGPGNLVEAGGAIITGISDAITANKENIAAGLTSVIDAIGAWLSDSGNISSIVEAGGSIAVAIVQGIVEELPGALANAAIGVGGAIQDWVFGLVDGIFGTNHGEKKEIANDLGLTGLEKESFVLSGEEFPMLPAGSQQQTEFLAKYGPEKGKSGAGAGTWITNPRTGIKEYIPSAEELSPYLPTGGASSPEQLQAAIEAYREAESAANAFAEAATNAGTQLESGFDASAIAEAIGEATETLEEAAEKTTEASAEMAESTESASSVIASAFQAVKDAANGTGSVVSQALSTTPDTSGVTSAASAVISALAAVAAQAAITYAAVGAAFSAGSATAFQNAGKFARGLEYVPYDDYPALLHKGEKVLTAQEAEEDRAGTRQERNQVNVNQYIQAVPMTPSELAFQTSVALEMLRFG